MTVSKEGTKSLIELLKGFFKLSGAAATLTLNALIKKAGEKQLVGKVNLEKLMKSNGMVVPLKTVFKNPEQQKEFGDILTSFGVPFAMVGDKNSDLKQIFYLAEHGELVKLAVERLEEKAVLNEMKGMFKKEYGEGEIFEKKWQEFQDEYGKQKMDKIAVSKP